MTLKTFNQSGGAADFADASNWTPNGVPGSSDDAVINTTEFVGSAVDETVNSIATGLNAALLIQGGSFFTTKDGTGTRENSGIISVYGAGMEIAGGTFDNPGTLYLAAQGASSRVELAIFGSDTVTLDGGGALEMQIGGGVAGKRDRQ